ncbi:flagellar biosynthetic protein FliO [Rhodoplanes sp. Z2-YC6860]|uniref:flagellar biosynthetic protein FliO n=1 Tax=Rhodoplanes sp. Z2-YC6860 TaxID=674703 RepID=UPI00078D0974|nr:flagellar biosynthetic protein FliO [Rhodoplanes sp. Z2-YC6860]AMN43284.1 flagellar biosynthesis protein FliO [Rhodoplanes sp. Z2-YC6860]
MNSLFGVDLPTPVNFVIAFVVVLLLIGAATWLVRRFGATRIDPAARGRQPRLAVVDAAAIDGRRKLVIVRRDNAEHLLMIGGPTDVVVETNILRAGPLAAREGTPARNGNEPQLRAVPEPAPWQPDVAPQPQPAPVMRAAPRVAADDAWDTPEIASPAVQAPPPIHAQPVMPAPPVRPVRPADTLASLAQELSQPQAPRVAQPEAVPPAPAPVAVAPQPPAPPPDQSLAEMAQRLEAALRRPATPKVIAEAGTSRVAVAPEAKAPARQPRVVVGAQPKGNTQTAAAQPNNLEQEMASLLNKPGKT